MTKYDLANMFNNKVYFNCIESSIDDVANKHGLAVFYGKSEGLMESIGANVTIDGEPIFYKRGALYTINGWNQDISYSIFKIWNEKDFGTGLVFYKKIYCIGAVVNIRELKNTWTDEPILDFKRNIIYKRNNIIKYSCLK